LEPPSWFASLNVLAGSPAAQSWRYSSEEVTVSFDVFLQSFAKDESAHVDRSSVRRILDATSYRGPDDFGFYVITFPDGGSVEFSASGLESQETFTHCAFHIHGLGEGLVRFIFDIARASDMVIMPAIAENPLILLSEDQRAHVPREALDCLRPVVI
jgi:hypothetical protein